MAEVRLKRTSYPSRQPRFGPAPLASFEDLSDEIPSSENVSPEESTTAEARDIFDLTPGLRFDLQAGNETEDDIRTFSDGITPSTPRVLAQTPSTPLVLNDFSAAVTPDSLGHPESIGSTIFDASPPNDVSSPKTHDDPYNIFSPRTSPMYERRPANLNVDVVQEISIITQVVDPAAERALAAAQEHDSDSQVDGIYSKEHSNISSLGTGSSSRSRIGSGTGSGSRVGSATPSPRSARKLFTMSFFKSRDDRSPSPIASPKSPLKLSPMASPKSPRKSSPFVISLFRGHQKDDSDHSPSSASPTRKKSHFPSFLRGKEPLKSPVQVQVPGVGKKEGKQSQGVFSTLFRRDHKDATRVEDGKTPEEEEWISFSRLHNAPQGEHLKAITKLKDDDDEVASPAEEYHGGIYINIFERDSPQNSRIVNIETYSGGQSHSELLPEITRESVDFFQSAQDISAFCATSQHSECREPNEEEKSTPEGKLNSPESEQEAVEVDLGTVDKPDEPEAETLLREDSFENEAELITLANALLAQVTDSDRDNDLNEISKRRERIASFQPNPLDRPRSVLPVSYSSFEEYVSFVSKSPSVAAEDSSSSSVIETSSSSKAKLKVTLPKEEFQLKQRQSRKSVFKNWTEFCEVGLQSPRSRRRHLSDRSSRSPSSVPTSRTATVEEDVERRTESLDYTLVGSGCEVWTTFEATHTVTHHSREISFESDVFANSNSKPDSVDVTDMSPMTETPFTYRFEPHSDSSRSSSPKDFMNNRENSAFLLNLGDEEVEPLVKEVLSRDISRDYLVDDASGESPYANETTVTPYAVQHFGDGEDKLLEQHWWADESPVVVPISKPQISDFNNVMSQEEENGFSETKMQDDNPT
ncbi:hypothetical protein CHUAL_003206 [Chamberlinius hualienensis]